MTAKLPGLHTGIPALRPKLTAPASLRLFETVSVAQMPEPRRRRIWELTANLHCSIIGTCLTTAELRQILVKMGPPGAHKETDHELHSRAVLLAGRKDHASKLLQKALDRRHRSAIGQFTKARDPEALRALWASSVQRAEIPGAYWAILTHPQATEDLVRVVFGEVHMLSHLVGAANRADIRRLRELEGENAALQEKVARQQSQLRNAVVTREATIATLNEMLGKAIATAQQDRVGASDDVERATAAALVADLRRRLASETAARERMQRRLQSLTIERDSERKERGVLQLRVQELRNELGAAELSLGELFPAPDATCESLPNLGGSTVLYVGGRAHQVAQLRKLAEQWGARFTHHDGGIDERTGLLESQVVRADYIFFPVDCVSHNAVGVIKRISRNVGKPFVVLRSSGLTSFAAALRSTVAGRTATNTALSVEAPS